MTDLPLLTLTLLCPAVALLLTLVIPASQDKAIKVANALCALASVVLAIMVWALSYFFLLI